MRCLQGHIRVKHYLGQGKGNVCVLTVTPHGGYHANTRKNTLGRSLSHDKWQFVGVCCVIVPHPSMIRRHLHIFKLKREENQWVVHVCSLGTNSSAAGAVEVWLWPAVVTAIGCARVPDPLRTFKSRSWTMSCADSAEDHKLSLQLLSLAKPQFLSDALRYNPRAPCKVSSAFVPESQSLWWVIHLCLLSCCKCFESCKIVNTSLWNERSAQDSTYH